jgi:hypothetical protein
MLIVSDYRKTDPTFHARITLILATAEPVPSLGHADASLAWFLPWKLGRGMHLPVSSRLEPQEHLPLSMVTLIDPRLSWSKALSTRTRVNAEHKMHNFHVQQVPIRTTVHKQRHAFRPIVGSMQ